MILKKFNFALFILPILIFTLGMMTLISISPDRAGDQIISFIIGIVLYLFISSIDIVIFKYYWKYIYGINLVLLILTVVIGTVVFGSARWIDLGFTTFQPSEFAKIAVVISLASLVAMPTYTLTKPFNVLKLLGLMLPFMFLVFIQPDLGTTIALAGIFVVILLFAGISKLYFLGGFILMGLFSAPAWNLLQEYQKQRVLVFINPSLDVLGSGYNVVQSIIAIGSGGFFGRGFGRGTQSHLQFLPAYWTDFIFASFAEEWGFIGVILLVFLFVSLLFTLIYIAYQLKDTFSSLLVIGVFTMFFLQFTINVGMNLGIMPVTGIPLPLFSYGGSSLITSFIALGLVQSAWVYKKTY